MVYAPSDSLAVIEVDLLFVSDNLGFFGDRSFDAVRNSMPCCRKNGSISRLPLYQPCYLDLHINY